ncbi:C-Myc-binding protein isoform X2 [Vidua macroura]|uniref:C-Myc-binding protein isoform X2 n=1 Tax=Vidua macroura TaxID=187451 RepID=UPI0023A8E7E3|nr:C-Myc-binding protein isoform X2 [Vidua macroura]
MLFKEGAADLGCQANSCCTKNLGLVLLVALYEEPEKPDSALDFLKHHLGVSAPENPEIEALHLEVAEMKEKYEAVLEENKKLKTKLAQYEPPQDEKHGE